MEAFLEFYQNIPSLISPTLFKLGGFELRWYSLGYIVGFVIAAEMGRYRIRKKENTFPIEQGDIYDAYLYMLMGIILGGRLGYLFFYDTNILVNDPLRAFSPLIKDETGWHFTGLSGMSYHGGLIGFSLGLFLFTWRRNLSFLNTIDFLVPGIALGYTFGRIGNFMNGELYGRITEVPWGMYFTNPSTQLPFEQLRHPSQLYEAFTEGICVFIVLWIIRNRPFPKGWMCSLYMIGYAAARFSVEFFRQPDAIFKNPGDNLGTVWGFLTMGQLLSLSMVVTAIGIMVVSASLSGDDTDKKST